VAKATPIIQKATPAAQKTAPDAIPAMPQASPPTGPSAVATANPSYVIPVHALVTDSTIFPVIPAIPKTKLQTSNYKSRTSKATPA
jgi:hypothetical protein